MNYLVSIVSVLIGFGFLFVAYYLYKAKDGVLLKALIAIYTSVGLISIVESILYYLYNCIHVITYIPAVFHIVFSIPVLISIVFLIYYSVTEKSKEKLIKK